MINKKGEHFLRRLESKGIVLPDLFVSELFLSTAIAPRDNPGAPRQSVLWISIQKRTLQDGSTIPCTAVRPAKIQD